MSVHLIDLRSDFYDVLLRITPFYYLYTLTSVVLNCLLVHFIVQFE